MHSTKVSSMSMRYHAPSTRAVSRMISGRRCPLESGAPLGRAIIVLLAALVTALPLSSALGSLEIGGNQYEQIEGRWHLLTDTGDRRAKTQIDVVVGAIKLQTTVDETRGPARITDEHAVVLIYRFVSGNRAARFIQRPMADQRCVKDNTFLQRLERE